MTERRVVASGSTALQPSRDQRLVPYCVIGLGGLAAAFAAGQPALASVSVPFLVALAIGLRRRGPVEVATRVSLDSDQVLEGDLVTGRIELEWDPALSGQALVHRLKGVAAADDSAPLSWALPARTGRIELPIELRATQWGRHTLGEVWLRLEAPFGLLTWTGKVASAPALRVLPSDERLTRLLEPDEPHAVLGMHRSRRLGEGSEFAELRPYSPGDRLRDLNWSATARHRRPFVNRHHPELSGDLVLALDAFDDGSSSSIVALTRAARAAWTLASVHLQANDRVGVLGMGGRTRWLPPTGGRRAKYQLLETLLSIGGEAMDPSLRHHGQVRIAVPPSALVVALTPLHDRGTLGTVEWWRARGRSVAVIVIDTTDLLEEPANAVESLARRLWRMELEERKRELRSLGIPVVTLAEDGPIGPAISALRRFRRAPVRRQA